MTRRDRLQLLGALLIVIGLVVVASYVPR